MDIIAIDVGGTKVAGALVSYPAAGDPPIVGARMTAPTDPKRGGEAVLGTIEELAAGLFDRAGGEVFGIGVGTAGVVNPADGSIRYANDIMPGYAGQPVRDHLERRFGVFAAVLGDVQAHALGEARWGAARGAHSCLCVGVGTGLGGAYVLDGRVVRGFRGAAGHIGHTLHPAASGALCSCGSPSHAETVTSGIAISAAYQGRAFADELDPAHMGAYVAERAAEGELEAMAVLEEAGFALGEAIGSWCNILDPELVVLSGSVTGAGHPWRSALDRGFKSQVLPPLADVPLFNAALGADAPLIGAAEHLKDEQAERTA